MELIFWSLESGLLVHFKIWWGESLSIIEEDFGIPIRLACRTEVIYFCANWPYLINILQLVLGSCRFQWRGFYSCTFIDGGYYLTGIELWSAYFDLETYRALFSLTSKSHLLTKSALSCWIYPTAQIALFQTLSHPWVAQGPRVTILSTSFVWTTVNP